MFRGVQLHTAMKISDYNGQYAFNNTVDVSVLVYERFWSHSPWTFAWDISPYHRSSAVMLRFTAWEISNDMQMCDSNMQMTS